MNRERPITFVVAATLLSFSGVGCGGGSKDANAKVPSADTLPSVIEHEPCDVTSSSAQKLDSNNDGKPDIVRVMSGGHEVCRMIDLNHDDKPDAYIYFDASGNIRRRESDFDRDGRLDEVAYYGPGGVIVRKDRETNLDGKLDTWDFYENGKLHHRLRDSDGDGKVDQWWSWPNPDKIECAVIASDHNNDGKPDPDDVIDVCAANAPPEAGVSSAAPVAGGADAGATLAASTQPSASVASADAGSSAGSSAASDAGGAKKTSAAKKKDGK